MKKSEKYALKRIFARKKKKVKTPKIAYIGTFDFYQDKTKHCAREGIHFIIF